MSVIYIKPMTQIRLLNSAQYGPKPLMEGCEVGGSEAT